jgi:predicted Fe-Mo cluster-binding NifX family protein
MNIAIASTGNNINSKIDKHLARCSWFMIYDSDTKQFEFIENKYKALKENAGIAVVKLFGKYKIKRVITTDVGAKVKNKLDELKIQIIIISDNNKKMKDLIKLMNHK